MPRLETSRTADSLKQRRHIRNNLDSEGCYKVDVATENRTNWGVLKGDRFVCSVRASELRDNISCLGIRRAAQAEIERSLGSCEVPNIGKWLNYIKGQQTTAHGPNLVCCFV